MEVFIGFVAIVCFIAIFLKGIEIVTHSIPVIRQNTIVGYKKRLRLMNNTESALFFELQRQMPKNYHIFPNMRLADIVDPTSTDWVERRNQARKIMPKHVDFIICDDNFKPIVAVELNGSSHNRLDRMEKDEEKKQILEDAKLPFVVVKVGDNFVQVVEKIRSYLQS